MAELIRGKVARVLNSREVALNVGASHGVVEGMQFDVLDPELQNIMDPDTDEVIGSVNRPKVRIRVSIIQDRFCVAHAFRRKRVNIGGRGFLLDKSMFEPPKWVTRVESLKTSEKTWEDLSEEDSYVKTGDPVVQVLKNIDTEEVETPVTHQREATTRKPTT